MARLEVEIGANIKGLEKALTEAELDMIRFSRGVDRAGKPLKKFGKEVKANAVPAMTSFSQVIQDAPFGIRGVANNITQLTAQLGHLSTSAGGTKNAFKSMLATLKGPGGILLAVSIITSLMVSFEGELSGAKTTMNQLAEATKNFIGSAESQKTTVEALLKVARDENKSLEQRERALNAAKKASKGYLDALTLENIQTEEGIKINKRYSEVLLQQAKIKGVQQRISDLVSKKYELENKTIQSQITTWGAIKAAVTGFGNVNTMVNNAIVSGAQNVGEELKKVEDEINNLTGSLQKLIAGDVDIGGIISGGVQKNKPTSGQIVPTLTQLGEMIQKTWEQTVAPKINLLESTTLFKIDKDKIRTNFDTLNLELVRFNDIVQQTIKSGLVDSIGNFSQAIGNAIASGVNPLKAGGAALLGTLADVMIKYGKLALAFGLASEGVSQAFKNPFGGGKAAIAGGAALIAVGAAIKGFSRSVASSGSSGSPSGGVQGSGLNISSAGANFDENNNVVFEIEGTKLVGTINRTLAQNRGLGGQLSVS